MPLSEPSREELRLHIESGIESITRQLEEHSRRFGADSQTAYALRRRIVTKYAMLEMFEAGEYLSLEPMGIGALEGAEHLVDGGASVIYVHTFANEGDPAQIVFVVPWKRFPKIVEAKEEEKKARRRELDRLNKK